MHMCDLCAPVPDDVCTHVVVVFAPCVCVCVCVCGAARLHSTLDLSFYKHGRHRLVRISRAHPSPPFRVRAIAALSRKILAILAQILRVLRVRAEPSLRVWWYV